MAHIEEGYLTLTRNDMTDIGTVEDMLDQLAGESDPHISQRAGDALDFFKEVLGNTDKMLYEDSVREWRLPIYDKASYDKKGALKW